MKKYPLMPGNKVDVLFRRRKTELMTLPEGELEFVDGDEFLSVQPNILKATLPLHQAMIGNEFYQEIGKIVVSWGDLECAVNDLIDTFIKHSDIDAGNWRRSRFESRRRLLMSLLGERFSHLPAIPAYFKKQLDEAQSIKWKRDIIAHGTYSGDVIVRPTDKKVSHWIEIQNLESDKHRFWAATSSQLEYIYYRLCTINGHFFQLLIPRGAILTCH